MSMFVFSQAVADGGSSDEEDNLPPPGSSFIDDATQFDEEDSSTQDIIDLIELNNSQDPDEVQVLNSSSGSRPPPRRIFLREEDEDDDNNMSHDAMYGPSTSTPRRLFAEPNPVGPSTSCKSPSAKRRCIEVQTTPSIGNRPPASLNASQSDEDAVQCPICLEGWTTTGEHRFVSLKCGHCFGRSCIEKWLVGKTRKDQKCPQCNAPNKISDIRPIYARALRAYDNSELNKALDELESCRCKLINYDRNCAVLRRELQESQKECEGLKTIIMQQQGIISSSQRQIINKSVPAPTSTKSRFLFALDKKLEVCADASCRALSFSSIASTLAVTHRSPSSLFTGYGVKLFSSDLVAQEFLPLHSGLIKDIVFKPDDQLLLSASLDKSLKITSLVNRKAVCTFQLDQQAWCCCWNELKTTLCYVGLKDGNIIEYDVRYNNTPVQTFAAFDRVPLVSIQYVKPRENATDFCGIHCTSLQSTCFYELNKENRTFFQTHSLPFEGKFLPGYYDQSSGYALISTRPSQKSTNVTHNVSISLLKYTEL